jgi:hypothetical protein
MSRGARGEVAAFAVVFAAYLLYVALDGARPFYYDSGEYWALAGSFTHDGHFSLLAYDEPLRGYSFPLLLGAVREAGEAAGLGAAAIVHAANAAVAALVGAVLFPRAFRHVVPEARVTVPRVLALNALMFVFWRDHLHFPLSDLPTMAMFLGAFLLVLRRTPAALLGAGLLAGLALNTRPAYLAAGAGILVAAALAAGGWRRPRPAAIAGALAVAGVALALAPQAAIDHEHFYTVSPFPPQARELSRLQLSLGLVVQKYETAVPPDPRAGSVAFPDPELAKRLRFPPGSQVASYGDYLEVVSRDPVGAAAGYLRHAFNGMDAQYPSPYVRSIDGDRSRARSLLLYVVLFAAALAAWRLAATRRVRWPLAGLLLLPCLAAIPSQVETRFFLAGHLAAFGLVAFGPVPELWRAARWRGRAVATAGAALFALTAFSLAAGAYALAGA